MTEEGKEVARWQVLYDDEFGLEHEMIVDVETAETADQLELWLDERGVDWEAYAPHYADETWGPWQYPWQ